MSRQIFIDCGAHCGCTRRKVGLEFPGYEIFSFEADPELCQYDTNIINKAVWIENCQRTFYKFGTDGGSSLSRMRADLLQKRKPNYFPRQEITVECFSLSDFLLENFSINDNIILKLDIEGAEYQVLNDLLNKGSVKYISKLLIEWHDVRCGYTLADNTKITNSINLLNIEVDSWDAMENSDCIINSNTDRKMFHSRS